MLFCCIKQELWCGNSIWKRRDDSCGAVIAAYSDDLARSQLHFPSINTEWQKLLISQLLPTHLPSPGAQSSFNSSSWHSKLRLLTKTSTNLKRVTSTTYCLVCRGKMSKHASERKTSKQHQRTSECMETRIQKWAEKECAFSVSKPAHQQPWNLPTKKHFSSRTQGKKIPSHCSSCRRVETLFR